MTAEELERWLSKEEWGLYLTLHPDVGDDNLKMQALESLAECRRLMEKHQWHKRQNGSLICICCGSIYLSNPNESGYMESDLKYIHLGSGKLCKPDCAWAKCIAGLPRDKAKNHETEAKLNQHEIDEGWRDPEVPDGEN